MRFLSFLAIYSVSLIMTSCASTLEEELDERAMDLQIRNVMQSRRTDFEECYAITAKKLKDSQPKKSAPHGRISARTRNRSLRGRPRLERYPRNEHSEKSRDRKLRERDRANPTIR